MRSLLALLLLPAAAAAAIQPGTTVSGSMLCGTNRVDLELELDAAWTVADELVRGEMTLRTDTKRVSWESNATRDDATGDWTLTAGELTFVEMDEMCGCSTDPTSDACIAKLEAECADNVLPEVQGACDACVPTVTAFCAGNATEAFEWYDAQDVCDTGYPTLCGCSPDYDDCPEIEAWCASEAVNVTSVCDACAGNYSAPECGPAIEAELEPMVTTQQCGAYADGLCVCYGDDGTVDATATDCLLAASATCSASHADFSSVCVPCFDLGTGSPYYNDECQEAIEVAVADKMVDQHCAVYEAPDICDSCGDDAESFDCRLSMAERCYTDAADEQEAFFCGNCTADFAGDDCQAHLVLEMDREGCNLPDFCTCALDATTTDCQLAFIDFCSTSETYTEYQTMCDACSADASSTDCATNTYLALTDIGCPFSEDDDGDTGDCSSAPDCGSLNRGACAGDNTCGECDEYYYGDAGNANTACEGELDYCESIVLVDGTWGGATVDTVYTVDDDESLIDGKTHFSQYIANATCEDEPYHVFYQSEYGIWVIDSNTELTDGFVGYHVWGAGTPSPSGTWFDATTNAISTLTVECSEERTDRSVPYRRVRQMLDHAVVAETEEYESYVVAAFDELDDDTCTGFLLAPTISDTSLAAGDLTVSTYTNKRVVSVAPDADEYLRVAEDADNLGTAYGVAFIERHREMIVGTSGGWLRYDMDSGEFLGDWGIFPGQFTPSAITMSADGQHMYRMYQVGDGWGDVMDVVDVTDYDPDDYTTAKACLHVGSTGTSDLVTWGRAVVESLDGMWAYTLAATFTNNVLGASIYKCQTPANGLIDDHPLNTTLDDVCPEVCELLVDDADFYSNGMAYLPDDTLIIPNEGGSILKYTVEGDLVGTWTDGTKSGLGTSFEPFSVVLTPRRNGVVVTDSTNTHPLLFDLNGNLIGSYVGNSGFATSTTFAAYRPGVFAPHSTFELESTFVAGDDIDATILARDAVGDLWNGSTTDLKLIFASQQEFNGELVDIVFEAPVAKTGADGEHVASYVPLASGNYSVSVQEGHFSTNLEGSPMDIVVAAAPVDAATTAFSGSGVESAHTAGEESSFVITYYDEFGNLRPDTPSLDDVEVEIVVGSTEIDFTIAAGDDAGTHVVTYNSDISGQHLISGELDGEAIGSSPYVVYVQPDAYVAAQSYIDSEATPDTDSMTVHYEVVAQAVDAHGNALTASTGAAVTHDAAAHCGAVTDNGDGSYRFACDVPAEEDPKHSVSVYFDGTATGDSPHALDFAVTMETVGAVMFGLFTTLAVLGILLAVLTMLLTAANSKQKIINAASPPFLYLILVGCILVFVVAILYGLDESMLDDASGREAVCRARPWFIGVGFQLVFGSLFAKTWRIAKIFNNSGLRRVVCKTSTLYKIVVGCVAFEIVYLAVWLIADPMELVVEVKSSSANELKVFERCQSENQGLWLLVNYLSKALMLGYGTVLAYKVRAVQSRFNESKWIALCLYNMMIMGGIFVPVSHLVWDSMAASFIIASAGATLSTCVIIGLLFGNKFMVIYIYKGVDYEAAAANGTMATAAGGPAPSHVGGSSMSTRAQGMGTPSSGHSRKLVSENQDLRRKVKELEEEISSRTASQGRASSGRGLSVGRNSSDGPSTGPSLGRAVAAAAEVSEEDAEAAALIAEEMAELDQSPLEGGGGNRVMPSG